MLFLNILLNVFCGVGFWMLMFIFLFCLDKVIDCFLVSGVNWLGCYIVKVVGKVMLFRVILLLVLVFMILFEFVI